ncbi:hypothetical protein EJB05_12604, partial [Eragrostis curvula]
MEKASYYLEKASFEGFVIIEKASSLLGEGFIIIEKASSSWRREVFSSYGEGFVILEKASRREGFSSHGEGFVILQKALLSDREASL